MEKEKWFKNPEMIVALTALFIGLLTAIISIYSAHIDRAYAKASVWPNVQLYRSHSDNKFSYGVVNNGTGPAIIKYVKVKSDERFIKMWSEIPEFENIIQSHISTITLPSGKAINPLVYKGDSIKDILTRDRDISIELCYCSIYDDCWVVTRTTQAAAVKECAAEPSLLFMQ